MYCWEVPRMQQFTCEDWLFTVAKLFANDNQSSSANSMHQDLQKKMLF